MHLTNYYRSSEKGDYIAHNLLADAGNIGYQARWKLTSRNSEIQM
jgi:hypothetical protein